MEQGQPPTKDNQPNNELFVAPISAVRADTPDDRVSTPDTDPFAGFEPYRLTAREEKQKEIFKAISKMPELWEAPLASSHASEFDEETTELVAEAAQRFSFDKVPSLSCLHCDLRETASSDLRRSDQDCIHLEDHMFFILQVSKHRLS